MKGHLKIELKDVNTGEVEEHEQDNMVTDAMANLLGIAAIGTAMNTSSSYCRLPYYLIPFAQKGLGGIFLFDGTLDERKDNIHFPMDVKLTGCAGRVANTSSKLVGSFNSAESHSNDNGYTSVWDFGTSQANGTIASLSLTNYLAGENPFYNNYKSEGSYTTDKVAPMIAFDSENGFVYLYHSGEIYKKKIFTNIIRANTPDFSTEEVVFDFNFSNPTYTKWTVCNGYDGYIYAINCDQCGSKKAVTFKIRKVKVSDFSFTEEEMMTFEVSNVTCLSTNQTNYNLNMYHCVSKGYFYFRSYDSYTLYKVNLSNTVDVKEITFGNDIGTIYIFPRYNGGLFAFFVYSTTTTSGAKVNRYNPGWINNNGDFLYLEDNGYEGIQNTSTFCAFEGDNLMFLNGSGTGSTYAFFLNYLGTICNLASPVTKTSAQTMKITYTLTDA